MTFTKPSDRAIRAYALALLVNVAYAVIAYVSTDLYDRRTSEFAPATLLDLANFTARCPYQYRLLVPATVHLIASLLRLNLHQIVPLYNLLEGVCVFAAQWAYRKYLATYLSEQTATLISFSIAIPMLLIHVCCGAMRFPTDTAQVLLFTLCLLNLRTKNWPWLYATVALAMFNRESTMLIVIAFAATMFDQLPRRRYLSHLLALSALCIAIKLTINHIFAHNPGALTEDHTQYNSWLLGQLLHGQPNIVFTTATILTLPVYIWLGRRFVPPFGLRLLVIVPLYTVGMYFVGVFDEVRAYNECVPVLLTPLLLVFWRMLRETGKEAKIGDLADEDRKQEPEFRLAP